MVSMETILKVLIIVINIRMKNNEKYKNIKILKNKTFRSGKGGGGVRNKIS